MHLVYCVVQLGFNHYTGLEVFLVTQNLGFIFVYSILSEVKSSAKNLRTNMIKGDIDYRKI